MPKNVFYIIFHFNSILTNLNKISTFKFKSLIIQFYSLLQAELLYIHTVCSVHSVQQNGLGCSFYFFIFFLKDSDKDWEWERKIERKIEREMKKINEKER